MSGWRGGLCDKCWEWSACFDGLCLECTRTVKTGDVAFWPALVVKQCVACPAEHDGRGELCPLCQRETDEQYEKWMTRSGW